MKKFGTAIILAGGKSSRMGYNKELMRVSGDKLINSQIKRLSKIFEHIIVVTNNRELYKDLDCETTSDFIIKKGPLGGIHAGLILSKSRYSYVIGCDMPIINIQFIKYQMELLHRSDAFCCMAKLGDYVEPFNAFYSTKMVTEIKLYLDRNRQSVHGLVKELDSIFISEETARKFSPTWDMYSNFNTKDDIKKYMKINNL